jgi:cysteine desulfurase family protein (TIGR01976 family)
MDRPSFDPAPLRAQFPAHSLELNGHPAVFFDNPGGTQVSQRVIDAVSLYYREQNANTGGAFGTSRRTDEVVDGARRAMADFLNAPRPENIVFGPNMTTLTFHLARSLAHTVRPGDEIIVTDLDHDANVTPWTDLREVGAEIKVVGIRPDDCTLDMEGLAAAITERTRLVAITHASNAVGAIPDVSAIIHLAHQAGALIYVDAVQYAPHGPIDVQALDCDFLACSAYKFFGPHVGILYGKSEHLERLRPHKVRPAKDASPWRWETGTLNHEGLAGTAAAVDYLAEVGERFGAPWNGEYAASGFSGRRRTLKTAMRAIQEYEKELSLRLIRGLQKLDGMQVYGITDPGRFDERLPTVAFTWPRLSPRATVERLAAEGICAWSGNYYALRLMEALGLEAEGGAVRIGLTHYNTVAEIDRLLSVLAGVAG